MSKNVLIVFCSHPRDRGTSLASAIGDDRAQAVYEYLSGATREVADALTCDKAVFYPETITQMDGWDNDTYTKQLQRGNDYGERLQNAFSWAFESGFSRVCIIGTDFHGLTTEILEKAFEFLDDGEAIIGPAKDGGYYLLGLTRIYPELFEGKSWGSYTVLDDTLQDFDRLELQYGKLPVLVKINEKRDLPARLRF